ncbi:hypothetical protein BGZ67_010691 [Mortierella alpina]|nr:hypothetical protein BGZ67_010691 [Mortierella alpina]
MSYTVNVPQAFIGQATTCLTCGIRLPSLETQQLHHKSDWHTYNLKRKMVYLPPVASEVFAQLVTASREQANPAEVAQPECVPCGKKYLSFQAYDNHVNSKKHKQIAAAYEKKQQSKGIASTDSSSSTAAVETGTTAPTTTTTTTATTTKDPVEQLAPSETVCLFCSHSAADASTNYEHMRTAHGFFLPSIERLIDLSGMLTYLAEKLVHDHDCLWCTPSVFSQNLKPDQELHSGFATLASVRRHMLDKGHCKLAMDHGAEREYADFYLPSNDLDSDNEDDDATEDSSMATDTMLDDDERKLNAVLLDKDGNWILDDDSNSTSNTTAGIRIDPTTNELVLNHRRLAHKDAARRQKVESRTVTLTSQSQRRPSSSTEETDGSPEDETATQEEGVSASSDTHHPNVRVSSALLRSQNQLSDSTLAVSHQQLQQVSAKVSKAQNFESFKREKMSTRLSLSANHTARRRYGAPVGTKV